MASNTPALDTSLASTQEAAKILGLSETNFSAAINVKWPGVLKPSHRSGKRNFYRVCDIQDFKAYMQNNKPKKVYAKNEVPEESNEAISSLIVSKNKLEKKILVLQNAHKHLCKAIDEIRK